MKPVLVFDLDDTLFPEHQFVMEGFAEVDRWLRERHGLLGFSEAAGALFRSGRRGRIFDEAIARLGWPADQLSIDQLVAVYREHKPTLSLHDDARWAIERFQHTHRLGLLTDGYLEVQRSKVRALGIESAFEAIVYSDEFGRDCWKPNPVPYRALTQRLACSDSWCTYVADNPTKDFVTANALGWNTIHIRRDDGEYSRLAAEPGHEAHHQIDRLYELERIVDVVPMLMKGDAAPATVAALDGSTRCPGWKASLRTIAQT